MRLGALAGRFASARGGVDRGEMSSSFVWASFGVLEVGLGGGRFLGVSGILASNRAPGYSCFYSRGLVSVGTTSVVQSESTGSDLLLFLFWVPIFSDGPKR